MMGQILFIPHGGGPLPLLGDEGHQTLVSFLKGIVTRLPEPSAILIISAHWEAQEVTLTSSESPGLIYDYYGFPDKAYEIKYPVEGSPVLAAKVYDLLQSSEIQSRLDNQRGFDHGVFVPLKIMYPKAQIPCVQMSLVSGLNPALHMQIGQALSALKKENILILGSGFSFHNLMSKNTAEPDHKNGAFEHWLINTCTNESLSSEEREKRLIHWNEAPYAKYCHPREEHLLPLHVCYGVSGTPGRLVFDGIVSGKKTSGFLW